ncbi:hypothetical protein TGAM01_v208154 [Trichoderma gamsii]|uniref:2EXR domain-containing protein n=1 Tax=Trichoderma gamsii TaxID=398673 RepID=A0A2P4ZF44_9HYPO|nr:hypothetical protein TGAM01_v208154 [Trichoderma gamsii]PON22899.1 hypothetical protein TGAM01_v208154 [Trichoderma gamsii]
MLFTLHSIIIFWKHQPFFVVKDDHSSSKPSSKHTDSNKRAQFSWEFESIVPFDVLMQTPTLAFPLYQRATISCHAAIPPLLHTCSESRSYLIRYGYQLAFPSTAQGPQTWFHFEQDTLLLDDDFERPEEKKIARIPYTPHHFRPQDISRVQRLALAVPTHSSPIFLGHKLNPELKELTLVEWGSSESEQALRQSIVDPAMLRPAPTISQNYYKGEHLCMLPVEETDSLWTTLELEVFGVREHWFYTNPEDAKLLKKHKLDNGFHSHFMKDKLVMLREEYEQQKADIEYSNKDYYNYPWLPLQKHEEYPPWSIHQIRFAHICTPSTAERIRENRSRFMEQFTKLAADAAQEEDGYDLTWTKQHRLPHPFVLQRYSNWPGVDESQHSIELEWWFRRGLPVIGSSI